MGTKHAVRHTPTEAIRLAVDALGGLQEVGYRLKPEHDPILSGQWLSHCLTDGRRDKLSLAQAALIFKLAAQAGHHDGFAVFAGLCGYDASPRSVEAELVAAVQHAQEAAHVAQAAAQAAQSLLDDNPELLARMRAANIRVVL